MQTNKVDAIYDLRAAAETKARAEIVVDKAPTPENRDALLEAKSRLEEKTIKAIDVCHECGHSHAAGAPHGRKADNVIRIDFERGEQQAD